MTTAPLFEASPLPKAQRGRIYALGRHRLMCGDATSQNDVAKLSSGSKPTLVVTSPPYADARDYNDPILCWQEMMIGAMTYAGLALDVQMLINLGVIHRNEQMLPYWQPWIARMQAFGYRVYGQYIWDKGSALPGAFKGRLSPSHEYVFHLNKRSIRLNKWVPTRCGRTSPAQTNVRQKNGQPARRPPRVVASVKAPDSVIRIGAVRFGEACGHPGQMPIALATFLTRTWKKDNCVAYDPFGGSATTLLACEAEGVDGLAMEISPAYCDMAMARWRKMHPDQAIIEL